VEHCLDVTDIAPLQRVPIKIYKDFLVVVEAQIGGDQIGLKLRRQNFLVDTGTAPSIINESVVKKLGLKTAATTLAAVGKTVVTEGAVLPELTLGPIQANALHVQVKNLAQVERDLGIPLAGIVGMDVLSQSSFHLDYERREMEFGAISGEGIPVSFDARTGIAVAQVMLEGRMVRMLVDTGSDQVLVLGGNLAGPLQFALHTTARQGASVAQRDMDVKEFSARDIELAGEHFSRDKAYFLADGRDPAFDGLLGVRALGFRGISFDQNRQTIYLQK
jgi:predicted aspartyl protease